MAARVGGWRKYSFYLVYVAAVIAACLYLFGFPDSKRALEVLFFLVLTLLGEAYQIQLPLVRGSISIGFVTIYAAVITQGVWPGIFVAAFGTVSPDDFVNARWSAVLYNRIQLGISAGLAGLVFSALNNGTELVGWRAITAFVLGGATYFVCNAAFFAIYVTTFSVRRLSWRRLLREFRTPLFANYIALLPLAYLIAVIFSRIGMFAVALFLLPLMVARVSFQRYVDMYQMFLGTIRALAVALEAKDRYTYGHADRVARLSVEIGKRLGMSDHELEILQYAAILHDIGKIGIRDEVLNKPGRYTPEEFEEMKRHPVIGARIVASVKALEQGADWIRHHHERYDGTGYPDGLKGEEIPLGARIIAVADAFDAMLYDRPYKAGRPLPEVIVEFKRSSGTHFDPKVVDVLLELIQDPRRAAELTRPPELSFIEFVGTLNGPVAVPSARQEAAAADEPRP